MHYSTKNRLKTRKALLPLILLVFLILGGVFVANRYFHHSTPRQTATKSNIDYTPGTPADNKSNEDKKNSDITTSTLNDQTTKKDSPSTGADSTPASFSATITTAYANSSTGKVHIGTLVNGVTTGDCNLTASKVPQPDVTKTAVVTQNVNYYSCGTFDIPFTDFPSGGDWKFTLTVLNDGKKATNTWAQNVTVPRA